MTEQDDKPRQESDADEPPRSAENGHQRIREKPLKIKGTLDDVLRAAVKEKPKVADAS